VRSVRNAFSNGPFLDAEDLRTRIRAVIQKGLFGAKVRCGKIANSRRFSGHGPDGASDV